MRMARFAARLQLAAGERAVTLASRPPIRVTLCTVFAATGGAVVMSIPQ
jgi:hypothetical protein